MNVTHQDDSGFERMEGRFSCRHTSCQYSKKQQGYTSNGARNKHERFASHHQQCPESCAACMQWQNQTVLGKRAEVKRDFHCSHNGCFISRTSKTNIIHHELHTKHTCLGPCTRCKTAQVTWKRKRETEEAAVVQQKREELQHNLASVATTQVALDNLDWSPALQSHPTKAKHKQAEVHKKDQLIHHLPLIIAVARGVVPHTKLSRGSEGINQW